MVLAMMFAATWVAYAAPEPEALPTVTPAATPATVSTPQDLTGKKVAFVDIAGAVNVKPETILALTQLKPGDVWTPDKIRQDLRLIYELGVFADVTADFTAIPEGVKVVYNVK